MCQCDTDDSRRIILEEKELPSFTSKFIVDKKIKIVYFIDDLHVLFLFFFSFSLWFTPSVLQFVNWLPSKPYRDA